MFYQRKIYKALLEHAKTAYVTVLTGMRRTGKTTLVKQLLDDIPNKNSIYLDLQRPDNREIFQFKNYDAIRDAFVSRGLSREKPMVIVVDEIQLVPEIPSAIKYLSDTFGIKFIVTGSSSFYLKNLFSESLAGRKKIFELFPLDFGEFLTFKEIPFSALDWKNTKFNQLEYDRLTSYYEEFIRFGGFPQVVLSGSESEKHDLLLDIMSSYINVDVRSLADFSDERNLYNLARMLASRVGSKIEYSKLSSLTGLSRHTVANYISFFEKTYMVRCIGIFTNSADREIVKTKKLYFCDTGLANTLGELSGGAQFENTLFNQISRIGEVQYYSKRTGSEIDFILDGKVSLEAKETPIKEDVQSVERITETIGVNEARVVGRYKSPKFSNYIWGGSIV